MTYNEFLELCREVQQNWEGEGNFAETYYDASNWRQTKHIKDNPRLFVEWSTGGYSGGSCWDNSDPQPYTSNEKPKELQILDGILERVSPNLAFLQYRALTQKLEKYDSHSVEEYYGNSIDYSNKTILVKELYDYLTEKQLI